MPVLFIQKIFIELYYVPGILGCEQDIQAPCPCGLYILVGRNTIYVQMNS